MSANKNWMYCFSCGASHLFALWGERDGDWRCPNCHAVRRAAFQSCGHAVTAIVSSDDGTHFCGECAAEFRHEEAK